MGKDLEREITEGQLYNLIKVADSLQNAEQRGLELDEKVDELMIMRRELQKSINGDVAPLTLRMAYEIAQEHEGIDSRFVDKAVRLNYFSKERQLEDIKDHNSVHSIGGIYGVYKKNIVNAFIDNFPLDGFGFRYVGEFWDQYDKGKSYDVLLRTIETKEKKRFMVPQKTVWEERELAGFDFGSVEEDNSDEKFNLRIILKDPLFLTVCGDEIKRLNDRFKNQLTNYEVKHSYDPEDSN